MRFDVRLDGHEWVITALSGEFFNQVVARAEGITLSNVNFLRASLVGSIESTWGLTIINDEVTTSLDVLKALGIGQPFINRAPIPFVSDGADYLCTETNRKLTHAPHVMLMQKGMFYGHYDRE